MHERTLALKQAWKAAQPQEAEGEVLRLKHELTLAKLSGDGDSDS